MRLVASSLTKYAKSGSVSPMGDNQVKDPKKKHRHDIGEVDHGPKTTVEVTSVLQGLMAAWILATAVLLILAVYTGGNSY